MTIICSCQIKTKINVKISEPVFSTIIIDSFRAEDLSTNKEAIVIDMFKEFENQIIFTTTLKSEEMGKYDYISDIHHIDYKNHLPSKLLNDSYVTEFISLLQNMSIVNI